MFWATVYLSAASMTVAPAAVQQASSLSGGQGSQTVLYSAARSHSHLQKGEARKSRWTDPGQEMASRDLNRRSSASAAQKEGSFPPGKNLRTGEGDQSTSPSLHQPAPSGMILSSREEGIPAGIESGVSSNISNFSLCFSIQNPGCGPPSFLLSSPFLQSSPTPGSSLYREEEQGEVGAKGIVHALLLRGARERRNHLWMGWKGGSQGGTFTPVGGLFFPSNRGQALSTSQEGKGAHREDRRGERTLSLFSTLSVSLIQDEGAGQLDSLDTTSCSALLSWDGGGVFPACPTSLFSEVEGGVAVGEGRGLPLNPHLRRFRHSRGLTSGLTLQLEGGGPALTLFRTPSVVLPRSAARSYSFDVGTHLRI